MICSDHWRHLEYLSHYEEVTGSKTVPPHSVLALTYLLPARMDRRPDVLCCTGVLPCTCNSWNQCWFRRVRKTAKSDHYLCHVCPSDCLSAWSSSASTGHIFRKFYRSWFFF